MNKFEFIKELLETKKISPNQKEKVLKLAANELSDSIPLINRIKKIEEIVFEENVQTSNTNLKSNSIPKLSKYSAPYNLYKYLVEYNQNRILKYTCHDIDTNALNDILDFCEIKKYNFQIHLEKMLMAFKEHDNKYFAPPYIKALIRGYLTGNKYAGEKLKDGWSTNNILMNWSHKELFMWCENNDLPPNSTQELLKNKRIRGFDIKGFNSRLSGKRIQNFRELVLHFKSLFHIRFDNSLFAIINETNRLKNWSNKIDFKIEEAEFPKNIELFTDVDTLIQAYNRILDIIIEQHPIDSTPSVKLSLYEKGTNVYLSIHHLNNTYKKSLKSTLERPIGDKYFNLIKYQLNGVCNLYLRADFGNEELAEINIWNGKKRTSRTEGLEKFEGGVEHILEFCKSKNL